MWFIEDRERNSQTGEARTVRSLERYFSVMEDEAQARFMVSKKVPVKTDPDSKESELWRAHSRALERFEGLLSEIDEGGKDLKELENPENSLLDLKIELTESILESCHFCEHRCGANRLEGERGTCRVGSSASISSDFIHRGEEPELVPSYTIFFSGCTLKCQFCQNWDISQDPENGRKLSPREISKSISEMREGGARNVNWVGGDPTPNLHNVLASLRECETNIPSVWNSNMYLTEEGMKLLSGTQDVYLTDFKYGNDECAQKYSKVANYWEVVSRNHLLASEDSEIIIRHLVLPGHLECCTEKILEWVSEELGPGTRVNLMGQYRPAGRAREYPELSRRISGDEMKRAFEMAEEAGLENLV